jgi:hypothetical protein
MLFIPLKVKREKEVVSYPTGMLRDQLSAISTKDIPGLLFFLVSL